MRSNTIRPASAFLALSCVGLIAAPVAAQAQSSPQDEKGTELEGVTVTDTAVADEVKVGKLESPKYTRPLLDLPQTVTVIGNTTIRQQNLLSLRDALATIPGITFGAGEGGGGYGDSINLRGQSANNDIQIDGVRDSAQYSRSDTFNLEQIEVVNGANSVYGGGGSISGTINLVTKRPKEADLTVVQGAVGTDDYFRGTVDSNIKLSDTVAFRLNAMAHQNDLPRRDFEYAHRWGVAPSITVGLGTPTRFTLMYSHQEDHNIPVYGVPYYASLGGLLPGASYSGYYGYEDIDKQTQSVDIGTAILEHDFTDKISLRNLTRWERVEQDTYADPPQGTYCLSTGQTTTGVACAAGQQAGLFYPSGPRGTARLTNTRNLFTQFDLRGVFDTVGIEHTINLGASIGRETYDISNGNVLRNIAGATPNPTLPAINIANPNPIYGGPINYIPTAASEGRLITKAVYLFDAIKLSEMFEINGGLRYEGFKTKFRSDTIIGTPGATFGRVTRGADQTANDNLFSYRVGLVFKPVTNASLYVAYGNSKTPVSSTVRSGCGTIAAGAPNVDPCDAKPQTAVNYEVGGKIDLMDAKLQLTASVFRNERTNFPVTSFDPLFPTLQVNDGKSRVNGITLGASGKITPNWTIFANYSYLDTKILQSISDVCKERPTTTGCTGDAQAGAVINQTPKNSGSLFTTYTLPFGLQLGYGATYQGDYALNNTGVVYRSKDYLIHRAMLSYPIAGGLTAQVNVQNFTNKKYYTSIRNNGWASPGEGRQAILSLFYSF
ncbi:TonB-dependent siderophore receptor [Sphingomonas sp. BIUV-7]|uniref:TonB-dependent siderophore receptor n=1 Tax=Sphingomonas natans TaxID=3063330 RepID=A0ABT8YEE0_9SPHN|nr:TonB-dependent siderophore receptor [Sphingomonas sp. BIUV-7]MDO6416735.1 TonB-dependent siderophore receptor [Sphingomonas sp. BIUV-7]